MTALRPRIIILSLVCLFANTLSSCAKPTPQLVVVTRLVPVTPITPTLIPITPSPISTLRPKPGRWVGKPSVLFTVTEDGKIRGFHIGIPTVGFSQESVDITIETDGTFLLGKMNADGSLAVNSVKGAFDSDTGVSGTYSRIWRIADDLKGDFSEEGSWNAQWRRP